MAKRLQNVINEKAAQDYHDDELFMYVQRITNDIYPDMEVVAVELGTYTELPLLHLDRSFYVDVERLRKWHSTGCTTQDSSCMDCVNMVVLSSLRVDATGTLTMSDDQLVTLLAKHLGQQGATRGSKRKEIEPLHKDTHKAKKAAIAVTATTSAKGGAATTTTSAKGGAPRFTWDQVVIEEQGFSEQLRRVAERAGEGSLPSQVLGTVAVDQVEEHNRCGLDISMQLASKRYQMYLPTDTPLPQLSHDEVGSFRRLIDGVRDYIATRVPNVPEVRIFYLDREGLLAFYQTPYIYANMAAYIQRPEVFSTQRIWFKTIIHETAHVIQGPHNQRFADVVQELMMQFVSM